MPRPVSGTRHVTRLTIGVQKRRKAAVYLLKPTVVKSVSACFAVRHNGAGEHDDLCWVMSALAPIASALPPAPDVADTRSRLSVTALSGRPTTVKQKANTPKCRVPYVEDLSVAVLPAVADEASLHNGRYK